MANNFFGQYAYKDSLIHNLDPRVKILLVIFISIFLFFLKTYSHFILISIFIILLAIISKIRFASLLKNLKPFLLFFIFILLMYYLFSRQQLAYGILTVWKFILLIIIASILTFSTSLSQLVYAVEKFSAPLRLIKASPRNIAVMVSATIRFIPLLFLEASKIRDAQESRGANLKKIKHIQAFITSLLRKTFNRASNLADAMESRCYRDYGYTHFRELRLGINDYVSVLIVASLMVISLWARI